MIRVMLVDDQELVRSGFRIILESEPDIEVVGEAANGAEAVELAAHARPDVICMDVEMPVMNGIEASRRILSATPAEADSGSGPGSGSGPTDPSSHARSQNLNDASGSGSGPAILILTTFGHETYLFDALAAGVSGFLLKTSRAEQLIDAVHSLAAGDALLGPDVTRAVIARVSADRSASDRSAVDRVSADRGAVDRSGADRGGASRQDPDPDPSQHPAPQRPTGPAATPLAATPIAAKALDRAGLTEREREVLGLLSLGRSNAEIAAELFLGEATVKTHVSNLLQKLGVRDRIQAVVWAHTHGG